MGIRTTVTCDLCGKPIEDESPNPLPFFNRHAYDTLSLRASAYEDEGGRAGRGAAELTAIFHPACAHAFAARLSEELNVEARPVPSERDLAQALQRQGAGVGQSGVLAGAIPMPSRAHPGPVQSMSPQDRSEMRR